MGKALRQFIRTSLVGGLIVILPMAIVALVFGWIFKTTTNLIQPLTNFIVLRKGWISKEILADGLVILVILLTCFIIGAIVRTRFGTFIHLELERRLLSLAPGYTLIKETVLQFLGRRQTPFSRVALARIFGNETLVTAFVTDEHPDGSYTVFVPTGPNPTSGNIFHLDAKYVHLIEAGIEDTMRSIISCGAGSTGLVRQKPTRAIS